MRPALFESQDSAGRFVLNAEESKSRGRKLLTDAACSEEAEDVTVLLPHSCIPEKVIEQ